MSLYIDMLKEKITKTDLEEYYCNQLKSIKECSEHFSVTIHAINILIKEYDLVKDLKQARSLKNSQTKGKHFEEIKARISRDELYQYYITEDNTYENTKKHFQLTEWTFVKLLNEYEIKKDRTISSKRGLETKYTNAGSKEAYIASVNAKTLDTKVKKYGSYENYIKHISNSCSDTWAKMDAETKAEIQSRVQAHGGGWNTETIKQTLNEKYGVDNAYKLATKFQTNSKVNQNVADALKAANIEYLREVLVGNKRYDFKVGDTLLEINPWPFHNSSWCPISTAAPLAKNYHAEKSAIARENGFRCIHIWDWDNLDIVLKLIGIRTKVSARACKILQVDVDNAKAFLNEFHVQGYARDSIRYGLYLNGELCSIMTFGKPRYNKNHEWELIRYCSKYNIIGGAEKLFKHFVDDLKPNSIVSYCDNAKFSGNVYQKLGFQLIKNYPPSKHWYNIKTKQHITDNLLRQRGFDQLFGTNYGKGTSNEYLMLQHNFVEIYDCGQSTYVWTSRD